MEKILKIARNRFWTLLILFLIGEALILVNYLLSMIVCLTAATLYFKYEDRFNEEEREAKAKTAWFLLNFGDITGAYIGRIVKRIKSWKRN